MKKLVLSQTCQGTALRQLLMFSETFRKEFDCAFIPNYEIRGDKPDIAPLTALKNALSDCDVLIYHDIASYDFPSLLRQLPAHALAIKIPYITSTIYWPTHDYRHPLWLGPRGSTALIPWPCLKLNELIVSLRDKAKVVEAYLALDIPSVIDIAGAFDAQMDYLKRAEKDSIFNVAAFVKAQFTQRKLFHLINHPALSIFLQVTNTILRHLKVPPLTVFPYDPFLNHQMPIHPSIIRHYGLAWCDPEGPYRILDKTLTFEEYVALYYDLYVEKYRFSTVPSRFSLKNARRAPLRLLKSLFSRGTGPRA